MAPRKISYFSQIIKLNNLSNSFEIYFVLMGGKSSLNKAYFKTGKLRTCYVNNSVCGPWAKKEFSYGKLSFLGCTGLSKCNIILWFPVYFTLLQVLGTNFLGYSYPVCFLRCISTNFN